MLSVLRVLIHYFMIQVREISLILWAFLYKTYFVKKRAPLVFKLDA